MILGLVLTARAAAPIPAWAWPTEEVKFHLETRLTTPQGTRYYATANQDAVAAQVHVSVDVACRATADGRDVWSIRCVPVHLHMDGVSAEGEPAEDLSLVLDDWERQLRSATFTLRQGRDGRVRQFDMEGLPRKDLRGARVIEAQRVLMLRAFSPFDLRLSDDPDAWVRGWEEYALSPAWQLPTQYGTAGTAILRFTPSHVDAELPSLRYAGRASAVVAVTLDDLTGAVAAADRRYGGALSTAWLSGSALFNPAAGVIEWRDLQMEVSQNAARAGSGGWLLQISALQRVDAFNANGSAPLSVAALRAPMLPGTPPADLLDGPLLAFAELGMNALYLPRVPKEAEPLGLDHALLRARVWVDGQGRVTRAVAFEGFEILAWPVEQALRGASFTARPEGPYVVDVEVDVRSEG